ncbi:Ig-like domain-containing protein [Agaribacterium haliotis]|uniref:Ig-like domain-containing protein n=1 Tax=Agaribacterium haliotis TaxID=2013869 RepID=UPI000BB59BF5|nr:Ig-like domain-containing protein [Agaribacterium haliotis]
MNNLRQSKLGIAGLCLGAVLAHSTKALTIEAEDFIRSGGGAGGFSRYVTGDGVGAVNHVQSSDWGEYQFNLNEAGHYRVSVFVGSPITGSAVQLSLPGLDKTVAVSPNGDWDKFDELVIWQKVELQAGAQLMRITAAGGSNWEWNMDRIEITPVATQSQAINDFVNTAASTPVDIDVLANDQLARPATISEFNQLQQAAHGQVYKLSDSVLQYVPDTGWYGSDSFSYSIDDGAVLSAAKVTVTVLPPASWTAVDDRASTSAGLPVTIDALANDLAGHSSSVALSQVGGALWPQHGSMKIDNNKIIYSPKPGFSGEDSFSYSIDDGNTLSSATVHVDIRPSSLAPPSAPRFSDSTELDIHWDSNFKLQYLQQRDASGNWFDLASSDLSQITTRQSLSLAPGRHWFRIYDPAPDEGRDAYSDQTLVTVASRLPAVSLPAKLPVNSSISIRWNSNDANAELERRVNGGPWQVVHSSADGAPNNYLRVEFSMAEGLYEYRLRSYELSPYLGYHYGPIASTSVGQNKLRILLVYPNEMLTYYGSTEEAEAQLHMLMDYSQTTFDNSNTGIELELVGMLPLELLGRAGHTDISHESLYSLRDNTYAAALKREFRPDLLAYISPVYGPNCGIAYYPSSTPDIHAISLTSAHCTSSVAHELGHNLGAGHGQTVDGLSPGRPYPWSMGYGVIGEFRTTMAYAAYFNYAPRIQFFSNPRLNECGPELRQCGSEEADAARGIKLFFDESASAYSSRWSSL